MIDEFDPTLPLASARTIPAEWYTSTALFEEERRSLFSRTWQLVGRSEQVREAGSFLTAEVAGEPILVVRGDDRVVCGFWNVCRHRAAPVMTAPCGQAAKFRCRYHGWTYDLSGRLRGTPEFEGVCNFTKEDHGLVPLGGVAEWGPFVFVHLEPPREPLEAFLSPIPHWTNTHHVFHSLKWHRRRTYDIHCNWKVYVDNYLDGGYHVNTIHPGLADVLDYKEYRIQTFPSTSLQSSPLVQTAGSVGETRYGNTASYWWVFPNFMLNHYDGVMDTNLVVPLDADSCRVIFDFYFADTLSDEFICKSLAVAEQIQFEDVAVCEGVQKGLRSRAFDTGRFSFTREAAGYHFHQLLAEYRMNSQGATK